MTTLQPIVYQHTDAVVEYHPAVDVEPTRGWRMECDKEFSSRLTPPQFNVSDCIGDSRRLTRRRGASASFTIYGTAFEIIGTVTAGPFSVRIDEGTEEVLEPQTAVNGALFAAQGLGSGAHRVTLSSAGENTELRFERVEFDAGVRSNWTKTAIGAREISAWTYSAGWNNLENLIRDLNDQPVHSLTQRGMITNITGSEVSFRFYGSTVAIFGNMMVQHARFAVTLVSPESPVLPADTQTGTFSSLSNYTVAGALMYFAGGLDRRVQHTLTLTVIDSHYFDLLRADVYLGDPPVIELPSSTSTPNPTSTPAPTANGQRNNSAGVIGGAIGGLFAGLACVILFYYLWKKQRRRGRLQAHPSVKPVDFTSPQPGSQRDAQSQALYPRRSPDGVFPIFLPSIGQSSYAPTGVHNVKGSSDKRNLCSSLSPVLTREGSSSSSAGAGVGVGMGRAQAGTLPPAYSAIGSPM